MKALVTGAGGFLGGHLVSHLLDLGYTVRATDIKPKGNWWQCHDAATNVCKADLTDANTSKNIFRDADVVFHLASNMGGVGLITDVTHNADVIGDNTLMDVMAVRNSHAAGIKKFLFTSSVCVYPTHFMELPEYDALTDDDVYPAAPNEIYGWSKLHMEHILTSFYESHGMQVYIPRLQNTYGPYCSWDDGREKAPAAICRKVAYAKLTHRPYIEVWGDGEQTRSFTYVGDTVRALEAITHTDWHSPVTVGTDEFITINNFIDLVCDAANYYPTKSHDLSKPTGVIGRVFDHTSLMDAIGWVPATKVEDKVGELYSWIATQVA